MTNAELADGRLSQEALNALLGLFAEHLAPRLAAEIAGRLPAVPHDNGEPWRLLSLKEAASRLGRSERWVRERVKRGDLAHVRLDGGALAFDVEDLQGFARERRVGGRPA